MQGAWARWAIRMKARDHQQKSYVRRGGQSFPSIFECEIPHAGMQVKSKGLTVRRYRARPLCAQANESLVPSEERSERQSALSFKLVLRSTSVEEPRKNLVEEPARREFASCSGVNLARGKRGGAKNSAAFDSAKPHLHSPMGPRKGPAAVSQFQIGSLRCLWFWSRATNPGPCHAWGVCFLLWGEPGRWAAEASLWSGRLHPRGPATGVSVG